MGLFDKKNCDICGEKIGLLGNRKLEDGNLCKDCAKKLSPWFSERRNSTVEEIRNHLAYREQNREVLRSFRTTRELGWKWHRMFIDETQGTFVVAKSLDKGDNPDVVSFSQIVNCYLDVKEDRHEEYAKDSEGHNVSYNPPRYTYDYDYYVVLAINSPYFDEIRMRMNGSSIDGENRSECLEAENAARQIMGYITQVTGIQPSMNTGMNTMGMGMGMNNMNMGMNMGMNPNMGMNNMNMNMGMNNMNMGMNPNMGMNNMNMGMNQGMGMNPNMGMNNMNQGGYAQQQQNFQQQPQNAQWTCPSCGAVNTGRFCENCGTPRQ